MNGTRALDDLVARARLLDAALLALEQDPDAPAAAGSAADLGLDDAELAAHFADREDFERALRARILEQIRAEIVPALSADGTPRQIVGRLVSAWTAWSLEHPVWHSVAEQRTTAADPAPIEAAIEQVALQVEDLLGVAGEVLGVDLDDDDLAVLDPLVFGLAGSVSAAVRRWSSRPVREPSASVFVERLTEATLHQVAGLAAARGILLDPDVPLAQLIASALGADEEEGPR